jgi:uncharacterized protein with HEPN domain
VTRDIRLFIEDILESITKIEHYTEGISQAEFIGNTLIQDAVLRRLEVMGEATKNLPNELREKYPEIPWREIAGLRDVLIHGYFGVNLARVWLVIERDLPNLKERISEVLQDM